MNKGIQKKIMLLLFFQIQLLLLLDSRFLIINKILNDQSSNFSTKVPIYTTCFIVSLETFLSLRFITETFDLPYVRKRRRIVPIQKNSSRLFTRELSVC